ncbi:MAG: hypothetical protein JOZ51_03255 [Chloroflexi bacterium]|nr:hypothetical protein [Chloroflexota bacterium]
MKSFKLMLAVVFTLTALTIPAATSSAAIAEPVLEDPGRNIASGTTKWPSLATGNGNVYVAWSVPDAANFAESAEQASNFASATLGSVGNNSTYFNAAVAVATDGTLHYAWINGGSNVVHRSRTVGGAWSPVHIVAAGQNFANTLNIAVRGNNEVYVAWRHQGANEGNLGFAYSNTTGVSWQVIKDVNTPRGIYAGRPDIVAGAANQPVYLAWTGADGNVYMATWNNAANDFGTECITCQRIGGTKDFFNPSVAMSTDGRPFLAWRSVAQGVYYGSRQVNGEWGFSRAFPGYPEISSVSIAVDKRDNVHLTWLSKQSNRTNAYYAVQKPGQLFTNPILVFNDNGGFKANLDMAVNLQSGVGYAHIGVESFSGGQFIRYARVRVNGIGCNVSAADTGDEASSVRAVYMNPIFFPMVSEPAEVAPPPAC